MSSGSERARGNNKWREEAFIRGEQDRNNNDEQISFFISRDRLVMSVLPAWMLGIIKCKSLSEQMRTKGNRQSTKLKHYVPHWLSTIRLNAPCEHARHFFSGKAIHQNLRSYIWNCMDGQRQP